MEWDDKKGAILNKVGLLCLALNRDYEENLWRISRIEASEGESLGDKVQEEEINNNLEIGSFVVDCEKRNKKAILRSVRIDDEARLIPHAFVDFTTSRVHGS